MNFDSTLFNITQLDGSSINYNFNSQLSTGVVLYFNLTI